MPFGNIYNFLETSTALLIQLGITTGYSMIKKMIFTLLPCLLVFSSVPCFSAPPQKKGLELYYWQQPHFVNFGDYLSLKIVERIVNTPVKVYKNFPWNKYVKLIALGSMVSFAKDGDVIWGSGVNGKLLRKKDYGFSFLDVRAVRGPLTRQFLWDHFQIKAPTVYGDPGLLVPYLFPEFKKKTEPSRPFILIPHYSESKLFPKEDYPYVVYPTDPWNEVIEAILDSEFVISSSLHGLVIADAYGIASRMLKISDTEPLFKYQDYYLGTNRPDFAFATTLEEALEMGPEKPCVCDLKKLYQAFPFEYWPGATFTRPDFSITTMDVK